MTDGIRLLIVSPPKGEIALAAEMARAEGAEVTMIATPADGVASLRARDAGLVMIDVGLDVGAFLASLAAERIRVPVLGCGIDAPAERAVAAIRAGARDYVPLPPDRALIAAALTLAATRPLPELVGDDPRLARAVAFGRAMAPAAIPVLIQGEPGTGKETLARLVHAASGRSGPFLTVECAGASAEVVESELWGHAAGHFPGAGARTGRIEQAAGGTLFVRDVERLPPTLQARLAAGTGDARLVASTAADIDARVGEGSFRADLRNLLAAARLCLPPLRERAGDLPALARHLAVRLCERHGREDRPFSAPALSLMTMHGWPGNVRELEDVVHRALLLARGGQVEPDALVLADGTALADAVAPPAAETGTVIGSLVGRTVDEVERELILSTLERCRGNRTSASGILGISVRTMRNKLKAFIEAGIPVMPAA